MQPRPTSESGSEAEVYQDGVLPYRLDGYNQQSQETVRVARAIDPHTNVIGSLRRNTHPPRLVVSIAPPHAISLKEPDPPGDIGIVCNCNRSFCPGIWRLQETLTSVMDFAPPTHGNLYEYIIETGHVHVPDGRSFHLSTLAGMAESQLRERYGIVVRSDRAYHRWQDVMVLVMALLNEGAQHDRHLSGPDLARSLIWAALAHKAAEQAPIFTSAYTVIEIEVRHPILRSILAAQLARRIVRILLSERSHEVVAESLATHMTQIAALDKVFPDLPPFLLTSPLHYEVNDGEVSQARQIADTAATRYPRDGLALFVQELFELIRRPG